MKWSLILGNDADRLADELSLSCFQSRAWVDAVSLAHNIAYNYAMLRYGGVNSTKDEFFLPGALRHKFGLPIFEAMPMGGYGGWVSRNGFVSYDTQKELTNKAAVSKLWLKFSFVENPIWSCRSVDDSSIEVHGSLTETHILDLDPDEEATFSKFKSNLRSDLRRSDKKGYILHRVAACEEAVTQFYKLYNDGKGSWKVDGVNQPIHFFSSLSQSGCSDVWLVEYEGEYVATAFFIRGRRDVFYYASGTIKDRKFSPSPMDYLMWAAIKYYAANGFHHLNFGGSIGLDGVRKFKEKFGAAPCKYRNWSWRFPRFFAIFGS